MEYGLDQNMGQSQDGEMRGENGEESPGPGRAE